MQKRPTAARRYAAAQFDLCATLFRDGAARPLVDAFEQQELDFGFVERVSSAGVR
jgi:hypothetical protein